MEDKLAADIQGVQFLAVELVHDHFGFVLVSEVSDELGKDHIKGVVRGNSHFSLKGLNPVLGRFEVETFGEEKFHEGVSLARREASSEQFLALISVQKSHGYWLIERKVSKLRLSVF